MMKTSAKLLITGFLAIAATPVWANIPTSIPAFTINANDSIPISTLKTDCWTQLPPPNQYNHFSSCTPSAVVVSGAKFSAGTNSVVTIQGVNSLMCKVYMYDRIAVSHAGQAAVETITNVSSLPGYNCTISGYNDMGAIITVTPAPAAPVP